MDAFIETRRQLICDSEPFLRTSYQPTTAFEDLVQYLQTKHPTVEPALIRAVAKTEIEAYEDEIV
ncbi:hypothetical protein [Alkalihalophilus marmarensis]|uniref:hypothetical protein n=1 Tax=Alkalihalophilus marmarensis TaxID=521377 RepID=UPI002DBF43EA|nr:hypothetical protein [Alkalihalophilus marmarensis]MEC2074310.1 hypothetical protein [Alkalihalophilus marmarensis]